MSETTIYTYADGSTDVVADDWRAMLGHAPAGIVTAVEQVAIHGKRVDDPEAEAQAVIAAVTERLWRWVPDADVFNGEHLIERVWTSGDGFAVTGTPGEGWIVTRPDVAEDMVFGALAPAAAVLAAAFTPAA